MKRHLIVAAILAALCIGVGAVAQDKPAEKYEGPLWQWIQPFIKPQPGPQPQPNQQDRRRRHRPQPQPGPQPQPQPGPQPRPNPNPNPNPFWWPFGPRPTPSPNPTPSPGPVAGSEATQVFTLINAERAKAGKPALTVNAVLNSSATAYTNLMIQSHQCSHDLGGGFQQRMQNMSIGVPIGGAGENIAEGQATPEAVVSAWMNSSGHKANILGNFDTTGVGAVKDASGNWWWCQQFVSTRRTGVFSAPGPIRKSSDK